MTPAVAAAKRAGIAFELHEYEHDPAHESYGLEAAEALGVAPERVFKTLVAKLAGAGLAVGIPSLMFYRYFRGRVNALTVDLEQEAIRLVEVIHGEREQYGPVRGAPLHRVS